MVRTNVMFPRPLVGEGWGEGGSSHTRRLLSCEAVTSQRPLASVAMREIGAVWYGCRHSTGNRERCRERGKASGMLQETRGWRQARCRPDRHALRSRFARRGLAWLLARRLAALVVAKKSGLSMRKGRQGQALDTPPEFRAVFPVDKNPRKG